MPVEGSHRRWIVLLAAVSVVVALIMGLGVGVIVVRYLPGWSGERPLIRDTTSVVTEVQGLNQLVTVRYVLEKVVILEDVKWYGENRVLLVAHGVAKAGVDLARVAQGDIKASGTSVVIKLPKPQLLDVYLDDRKTEVVERTTGLLREFDKDLEQDARRQAVDKLRSAAYDAGILKDAKERAQVQLKETFRRMGFVDVRFE